MRFDRRSRRLGAAALGLTVLGAAAATLSAHPAAAAGIIGAATTVTCSVAASKFPNWCINGTNTSSGVGVVGASTSGTGVLATTSSGTYALYAKNYKAGSNGNLSGVGIWGEAQYRGVFGNSIDGSGTSGFSTNGAGVEGSSQTGPAVYGSSQSGPGVSGESMTSGSGLEGYSRSGNGVQGDSDSGYAGRFASGTNYGVFATSQSNVAFVGRTANGNASDIQGSHIGLLGRSPKGGFPLVLTDATPNTLFYVDGYGNVYYAGSLYNFASTIGGGKARSFNASATQPTIEDTGTAQLVNGVAVVRLDPTFAAAIDRTTAYRVFVTPAGDTRGLFVATRTTAGFVVRESQAGRSTVAFDYRVVATALGKTGQRMAPVNAATDSSIVQAPLPVLPTAAVSRHHNVPALPSPAP